MISQFFEPRFENKDSNQHNKTLAFLLTETSNLKKKNKRRYFHNMRLLDEQSELKNISFRLTITRIFSDKNVANAKSFFFKPTR